MTTKTAAQKGYKPEITQIGAIADYAEWIDQETKSLAFGIEYKRLMEERIAAAEKSVQPKTQTLWPEEVCSIFALLSEAGTLGSDAPLSLFASAEDCAAWLDELEEGEWVNDRHYNAFSRAGWQDDASGSYSVLADVLRDDLESSEPDIYTPPRNARSPTKKREAKPAAKAAKAPAKKAATKKGATR